MLSWSFILCRVGSLCKPGTQLQTAVATSQSSCHATSAASDAGSFFPALLPAVSSTASSWFSPYVPEINLCLPQTWLLLYTPCFACGVSFLEPKLGAAIVSTLILTHGHSSCPVFLWIVSQIWSFLWFVAVVWEPISLLLVVSEQIGPFSRMLLALSSACF